MKKIYLGLMVTAALLGGSVTAYAGDDVVESAGYHPGGGGDDTTTGTGGTLLFDGDVYTGSCKIKVVGVKDGSNTIYLNSVRTSALSTKGDLVNRTDFSINLKDCGDPDGKHGTFTRKVKWTGSSGLYGSGNPGYLKNTDNTGAANVAFALTNPGSNSIIKPGSDAGKARDLNDGTWDVYKYQVSYVSPAGSGNPTGGHVSANATYQIFYE
ncbi:type 1 fimbrial protein [Enterobacteriaceae bacterium G50]|nr:type 1 fimbrial protein [Enterobacteriaceae bacterium G50]